MALTHAQKTGLEAAIVAHLTTEGERFARTVAALEEEMQLPGAGGDGDSNLVLSGAVLKKAWAPFEARFKGLEVPIFVYLTAQGGQFARTAATFKANLNSV